LAGVVRFRRHDKHGFDGQFLEMHARCTDYKCTAASTAAGFVDLQSGQDWTNGGNGGTNTAFTIMLVMKTYQTPGDVNPMGVLHLANGGEKKGFGLYKIPSKCKPTLKSTIHSIALKLTGTSMSHIALKTDNWGLRSTKPGDYNGKYMHFKQAAVDAIGWDHHGDPRGRGGQGLGMDAHQRGRSVAHHTLWPHWHGARRWRQSHHGRGG